mgnify:CR=1 FL=1
MDLKVTVGGTDITAFVLLPSILISERFGQRINTADLTVRDTGTGITTWELQEIIISNAAATTRYFAGYVASRPTVLDGITPVISLHCQDYTLLLEMATVRKVYDSQTDKQIIQDAVTVSTPVLTEINVVSIGGTTTINKLTANSISVRKLIDMLSELTGMEWYVDYSKVLHYFAPSSNYSSNGFSTSPDNVTLWPMENFSYDRDGVGIVNQVLVEGGKIVSDDQTRSFPANGTQTKFKLPESQIRAPSSNPTRIVVERNTGTDGAPVWTAKTVGLANIDNPASYDTMWSALDSTLEWTVAPSNLISAFRVTYRFGFNIQQTVRNQPSIDTYGRAFAKLYVDHNIQSPQEAEDRGNQILNEQANAKQIIKFDHLVDGFTTGQQVQVVHGLLSLNAYYTVTQITKRVWPASGALQLHYSMELAGSHPNKDIIDNLVELNRKVEVRDPEADLKLLQLFELTESLALSHAVPTVSTSGLLYYCKAVLDVNTIQSGYWVCRA